MPLAVSVVGSGDPPPKFLPPNTAGLHGTCTSSALTPLLLLLPLTSPPPARPSPPPKKHPTFKTSLQGSMAPFLTQEVVDKVGAQRRLRVIGDVSCDPNSTNNPIPLYDAITSW